MDRGYLIFVLLELELISMLRNFRLDFRWSPVERWWQMHFGVHHGSVNSALKPGSGSPSFACHGPFRATRTSVLCTSQLGLLMPLARPSLL